MMDWLNDKKNMPFVAAGLAVILIGVGLMFYFLYFRQPTPQAEDVPVEFQTDETGMAPVQDEFAAQQPTSEVQPDAAPAAQPGVEVAKAQPMEAWRRDPFLPIGYIPPKVGPRPAPRITDFPFFRFPVPYVKKEDVLPPEPEQPVRRMAGVLVNDRILAIIITDTEDGTKKTEIVKPGDTLSDRLAIVEKIERDKVILKTVSERPRYLIIRMAAAAQTTDMSGGGMSAPQPTGGGFQPGMMPM